MIKALKKLGTERMYLNIIKAIYNKPLAKIIQHGEKLKLFPLSQTELFLYTIPIQYSP
jgi:hypothetical protein